MGQASPSALDPAGLRALVPMLERVVWLDTPAAPPALRPVLEALRGALDEWEDGSFSWRAWEADAYATRRLLATLLGVREGSVALVASLAEAAATVAASLPAGRIVVSELEFRSNLYPWLTAAADGHEIVSVPARDGVTPLAWLLAAIDERTVLVAVSEVVSSNGNRAQLAAIGERCRGVGARFFVNLTQSLGALRFDGLAVDADYVAVHGYKWLLAPRGAGWLYVRPDRLGELRPLAPSWRSSDDPYRAYFGGPLDLAGDARRLDTSFSWLPWIGARAALEVVGRLDAAAVEAHVLRLAANFRAGAAALGLTPLTVEHPSQIVVVPVANPDGISAALAELHVVATLLGSRLRVGFHAFNDDTDVAAALLALERGTT